MSGDITFSLASLSTELLLLVFSNLSIADLVILKCTCKRFYKIIHHYWDIIIFKRREQFLVTNQYNEGIQKRSPKLLSPFDKHRISNNWQIGRYVENYIFLSRKFIPYFDLKRYSIWFGKDSCITCYQRSGKKINLQRKKYQLNGFNYFDICKFVIKDNHVSTSNGHTIQLYSLQEGQYIFSISLRDMYATSIDMESNLIAVGSKEGAVQLFAVSNEFGPVARIKFKDRIWSLAFNDDKLAVGTAANNSRTSIGLVDTQRCILLQEFSADESGAGVLHIKWDNPSLMWTGGYDMCLRRWDLRIGQCIQKFTDPWGSKVNCFDLDFVNTAITGCDDNRVTLWDIRKDKYVQIYYMKSGSLNRSRSPIYSLSFDAEYLFAATDNYLNILDFSVIQGGVQDYSDIFSTQLVI